MTTREATHAGSWYSASSSKLSSELNSWLDQVSGDNLPLPNSRIIIAPHAGYSYSGPTAAYAYANLDVSKAKRIFLLGPSHHAYLNTLALSSCASYSTPFGPLPIDLPTTAALHASGNFSTMSLSTDEAEHSLELHLPYIHKILSRTFGNDASQFPPLVPILVGNTSPEKEAQYGKLLAPWMADEGSCWVVSSDFAHWGQRFAYTYYLPDTTSLHGAKNLRRGDKGIGIGGAGAGPKIWESIEAVDRMCMDAVRGGRHSDFTAVVESTGNTVCGRHPIGLVMAAVEVLRREAKLKEGRDGAFEFVRYEQSSRCVEVGDSSVSYASAVARLELKGS